jgi:DNA-binding response OmpR family regulator
MEKEIPDLIVSDIMMPDMDGLEFCTYIKTNEGTNHIPVILLTAKASTDNKIEGLSTGADAYISKPFSIKVLKLSILNLLSSKEILRLKYSGNFIVDSDLDKLTTPEEMFIKKLMRVIEENMENPDFDVNMLVKEIGMSRTILYKKVSTLTNHSVASLIKHLRLKKAADIIQNTTYPISEVAFMVGFNDRKHFSREFKKVYKVSPTVYKSSPE